MYNYLLLFLEYTFTVDSRRRYMVVAREPVTDIPLPLFIFISVNEWLQRGGSAIIVCGTRK